MRTLTLILVSALFALIGYTARADEASVKSALQKKYPQIQVQSVTKTPLAGFYEVFADGQIIYTDEKAAYLFMDGRLIDTEKKIDLTAERMNKLSAVNFDQLPLDLAFRKVKGKGTRKLAYFGDPNCGYCKKFEQDLAKIDDVTIYVFLYPVLGPDSLQKAKSVWCSKDKAKVWDDQLVNGVAPTGPGTCDTPIDKILAYGRSKNITGTPTMFFVDGSRVPGAIPYEQIEQKLASAKPGAVASTGVPPADGRIEPGDDSVTAITFTAPGSFDRRAWHRLLGACALSALLHLIVLGVPVNPTGGLPNVVSTIQARLENVATDDSADSVTPEPAVTEPPAPFVDTAAEKTAVEKPPLQPPPPPPKPAAASPSSPGSGVEVPLIRDPTYYPARQLDVYPQPVVMIQPRCPDDAVAQRINGRVQLLLLIDEFGVVNEASIVEAQPAGVFDDATLQGFRLARFVPAQKQGNKVKSRVILRVNFLCSDTEASAR